MVTLTNGKRSKTQKTAPEKLNKDSIKSLSEKDAIESSSNQDSDSDKENENENEEPQPPESFADRLKILKINDKLDLSSNPTHIRIPVNSLAQTLIQALNSSDNQLLETCLIQSNKQLIANTIQRIPTALVHNLIEHLIIGLNKKRGVAGEGSTVSSVRRTRTLIEWVRQLLLVHMSYLITIPELVSKLTILHGSLQKRLNLHSKLLSLNGRLDLILNQIERNKSGNPQLEHGLSSNHETFNHIRISKPNKTKAKQKSIQPPVKYVEGESTDEEDEDEVMETKKSQDSSDEDSEDDGSIEDVVLGSESGSDDDDEGSSDEDDLPQRKARGKVSVSEGLFDLEAELSGSEENEDDEDDEDDEEDQDDEDEDMADFIDDGSGDDSDESD